MAIRVFLVEDMQHAELASLLGTLGGFEVVGSAATEAEAIDWLARNETAWDLAVVDLVLDQGTGMGVVARCGNRKPGAQVVVFSEYVTPGIRRHCLSLGANVAIAKSDLQGFIDFCKRLTGSSEP